jgi:two-component system OmpR family sensor kinase
VRQFGLRSRLVAMSTLTALLAVGILVVGLQVLMAHLSDTESLGVLRARADVAASSVRGTAADPQVLDRRADALDQNVWVFDIRGHQIDGAPVTAALLDDLDGLKDARKVESLVIAGDYRLLARPVSVDGHRIAVVVAGLALAPYEHSEQRGLWLSLGLGLLAVLAAGSGAWVAGRSALRPVREMALRADDWREHDLDGRFALGPPYDEITALGATLDRMLDRISQAILAERRLTDEVAHELRTPLAVIRSEAELALLDRNSTSESLQSIIASADRMNESISTMLTAARGRSAARGDCAVTEVFAALGASHPREARLRIDESDDPRLAVPLGIVTAALGPVVDNALRHAATEVRITIERQAGTVRFVIADDGPGVAQAERDEIFRPGVSGSGGAGLGLALARRLARGAGGELVAADAAHGLFWLDLPAAD